MSENIRRRIVGSIQDRYIKQQRAIGMARRRSISAPVFDAIREHGFIFGIPHAVEAHYRATLDVFYGDSSEFLDSDFGKGYYPSRGDVAQQLLRYDVPWAVAIFFLGKMIANEVHIPEPDME